MKPVIGLFRNFREANIAVEELFEAGFSKDRISVIARESALELEGETTAGDVAESTGKGAAVGAGVGGLVGLLAGIGAITIPGLGPILAAGTLAATIGTTAGSAAVGAAVGGILGAMVSLSVPEDEAHVYAEGVRRGGILVLVKADEANTQRAGKILEDAGALDINELRTVWEKTGWRKYEEGKTAEEDIPPLTVEDIRRPGEKRK